MKINHENVSCITQQSEILWIQATQRQYFADIFKLIKNPKAQVSATSRSLFSKHAVFLDKDLNILRCTTRNEKSMLEFSTVFPILLPSAVRNSKGNFENCPFTLLLAEKDHIHCGHQGVPNTLSFLEGHVPSEA